VFCVTEVLHARILLANSVVCFPDYQQRRGYRGADKSLARPASLCTLFDGENISFDASLVLYI
jgi:hypothetical protein